MKSDNDLAAACESFPRSTLGSIDEETEATESPSLTARGRRVYGRRRVTEEHKRELNRAAFRRSYQRKQQTLCTLREQVAVLTAQYEQLKLSNQVPDPSIMRLIAEKDILVADHAALQHATQEQLQARRWLQLLMDRSEHDAVTLSFLPPPFVDMTATLCQAIYRLWAIRNALERSPENTAFGWHCWSQCQDGDHVAFHVAKVFPATAFPLTETTQRTCEFSSESTRSSRMPSSVARFSRRILPRCTDKTTRLVYRQLVRVDDPKGGPVIQSAKSVYAVTLVPLTSGAWAIVSYSVPNQEAYDPVDDLHIISEVFRSNNAYNLGGFLGSTIRQADDVWIQELTWWRIMPSEIDVQVTYAGRAPVCLGLSPSACFVDVLQRVVEWEQIVLGARILETVA